MKKWLAGICLIIASHGYAAIGSTPVQQSSATSSGNLLITTMTVTPTNGNFMTFGNAGADTVNGFAASISETGVTWHKALTSKTQRMAEIWYGEVGAGASKIVTITLTGTPSTVDRDNVSEWSGVDTSSEFDTSGSSTSVTTTPTTASITPAAGRNVLLIGVSGKNGTFSSGPTGGWTALDTVANGNVFAYLVVSSASGSYSTSWTYSTSTGWDAAIADFLAPAAASSNGMMLLFH